MTSAGRRGTGLRTARRVSFATGAARRGTSPRTASVSASDAAVALCAGAHRSAGACHTAARSTQRCYKCQEVSPPPTCLPSHSRARDGVVGWAHVTCWLVLGDRRRDRLGTSPLNASTPSSSSHVTGAPCTMCGASTAVCWATAPSSASSPSSRCGFLRAGVLAAARRAGRKGHAACEGGAPDQPTSLCTMHARRCR